MPLYCWLLLCVLLSFGANAAQGVIDSWVSLLAALLLLSLVLVISLFNLKLRQSNKLLAAKFHDFKQLYDNAASYIMALDTNFNAVYVNRAGSEILASGAEPVLIFQDQHSLNLLLPVIADQTHWQGEAWLQCKASEPRRFLSLVITKQSINNAEQYLIFAQDITAARQTQITQTQNAMRDVDSGLASIALFNEFTQRAIYSAATAQSPFGIVMLKVSQTLQSNIVQQQNSLAKIIQKLADGMQQYVNSGVVVGRYCADAIVMLIPSHLCSAQANINLNRIAHKILLSAEQQVQQTSQQSVQIYAGVSTYPLDGETTISLINSAANACSAAAKLGNNNLHFSNSALQAKASNQLTLETELFKALQQDEFEIYYQPRVSIGSNRVIGYEALLRWHNPKRGILAPQHFIELANDSGVIVELDKLVLQKSCEQLNYWQRTGLDRGRIAINISIQSFRQTDFVFTLQQQLEQAKLTAVMFELELHEDIFLQPDQATHNKLRQLSNLGFHLTLDNFGEGMSSLTVLQHYPLHNLKIAQCFINDMEHNEQQRNITASIVRLASYLQLNVIATGIENEMQAYLLHVMGCDILQGHLFSKAIPATEIPAFLARESKLLRKQLS
ncbi:GGDEF domain-containing phosphodiesterase [Rheinheimera maricola]|uniref:Bifunctional diguanylate cyclase/phosphodiesterase n=1 Tax=Rheinheimera maricola TaxID=2793282 RepID=A0ABS7X7S3_9GAMM|nr:GGDEF domain-containing phosphodiesterase [Rheinheimera maricola]MBZ9611234.1 bifunctional diguanylate cyclase/phosphodiesterase [Rheinheimera maricola]